MPGRVSGFFRGVCHTVVNKLRKDRAAAPAGTLSPKTIPRIEPRVYGGILLNQSGLPRNASEGEVNEDVGFARVTGRTIIAARGSQVNNNALAVFSLPDKTVVAVICIGEGATGGFAAGWVANRACDILVERGGRPEVFLREINKELIGANRARSAQGPGPSYTTTAILLLRPNGRYEMYGVGCEAYAHEASVRGLDLTEQQADQVLGAGPGVVVAEKKGELPVNGYLTAGSLDSLTWVQIKRVA
ncbi:hypothetical protein ACFL5U_00960 [Candidatus Margulisiibacteriota bacterium]